MNIASKFLPFFLLVLAASNAAATESIPAATHSFPEHSAVKVELGRNLMFDKILSGNKNISCGTCHHSLAATGDGLSLPVGEGGQGLGVARNVGSGKDLTPERVPRNAPDVFNRGDESIHTLFHDGRVSMTNGNAVCDTPAGDVLPQSPHLDSVLACQAMFPVTSAAEMLGDRNENKIAKAFSQSGGDLTVIWDKLADRLRSIPAYVVLFAAAFNDVNAAGDITFAHAANAIAAFESEAWRADDSPFDRYLKGDRNAMSQNAIDGMNLFYNGDSESNACADCHSGLYQTDQDFHAIAMPQIGPGRGSDSPGKSGGHEDFGREQETGEVSDRFKFRTPSLRNVVITAPYSHSGAYNTLRAVVEHHLDPVRSLNNYVPQAVLATHPELDALNYVVMEDPERVKFIADHNELGALDYTEDEVDRIMDFLFALTDPRSLDLRDDQDVVLGVPSGLPLAD